MSARPKLLKARQRHSRVFLALLVFVLVLTEPKYEEETLLHQLMILLGYPMVILGAMGRAYCSTFIGGRKNDTVVREGPFSVVRNPLYVFSFIATMGVALESGMVTLVVLLAIAFAIYYPFVVSREEAFLRNKFGAEYETFLREVPRWLPNFKLWREPELVEARPKFIRRTLMDASIFFLPLPCFVLIDILQDNHILPVLLKLP